MKPAFTLHCVHMDKTQVPPKTVIELSDKAFDELLKLKAIRVPTDEELALHGLGKPKAPKAKAAAADTPKAKSEKAPKATKAKAAKADEVPDEQPEPDVDADVAAKDDADDDLLSS